MKKIIYLLIILCSFSIVNAQSNEEIKSANHEIMIDVSTFISLYLISNESIFNTPAQYYLINYKYHFKKFTINSGLSISGNKTDRRITGINNKSDYKRFSYDLRLGIQRTKSLSEKWNLYYGLDFINHFNNIENESEVYLNYNENQMLTDYDEWLSYGLGPVLGIKFKINDRFSINTESTLYYSIEEYNETVKFSKEPEKNSKGYEKTTMLNLIPPSNIYVSIYF